MAARTSNARRRRARTAAFSTSSAPISARLTRELGPADRVQVDEYLESVREVERRIQTVERLGDDAGLPALERPQGIPETFGEHVKLMYELQWLAFQADLTRVVTFMLGRELNFRTYPEIGLTQGHHTMSHHQERPENIERYAKLNTYQTDLFAWFLSKLASTPEGDGTLLDHSMFLYGGAFGNPNLHAHIDLPLTLVGGPAGRPGGGQHQVEPSGTPLSNLLLTMLDGAGVLPRVARRQHGARRARVGRQMVSARSLAVAAVAALRPRVRGRRGRARLVARGREDTERRPSCAAALGDGGDPNEADADGTSALHWAVHRGAVESVSALLAAGAAVDAENRYGVRPDVSRCGERRCSGDARCCSKPVRTRTRFLPRARRC